MSPIKRIQVGVQVRASESCNNSHNTQPSTYINVDWALFPCCSKINPQFRNTRLLPGIAKAILFPLDSIKPRVYTEFIQGGEV